MKKIIILFIAALFFVFASAEAKTERSRAARAAFVKAHPCPATGRAKGACPGWQVDHVTPLKCGGADAPANMQWLTLQAHKAKTKREAALCRKGKK